MNNAREGPARTPSHVLGELARHSAFASRCGRAKPGFETRWPADTEEISYSLDGFPDHTHYCIGSTRAEEDPIRLIGFFEAAWAGRSPRDWLDGDWSEPRELVHLRGLIGRVGIPPRLQVVIYDQELAIQLIGYHTEDEIMSAARSLRQIDPD
jgi:hypothetical protein